MARKSRKKRAASPWNKIAAANMKACRIQAGDSTKDFSKCLSTRLKAAGAAYRAPTRKGRGKKS